jgi:hypothetical protein
MMIETALAAKMCKGASSVELRPVFRKRLYVFQNVLRAKR